MVCFDRVRLVCRCLARKSGLEASSTLDFLVEVMGPITPGLLHN